MKNLLEEAPTGALLLSKNVERFLLKKGKGYDINNSINLKHNSNALKIL